MLQNSFIQLIGIPPFGFEYIPYVFSSIILFSTCLIITLFIIDIYKTLTKGGM